MKRISEMTAGDGSGLALPPAFVFINPKSARRYKKSNQDRVDGRTKGAKQLLSRITRRKMKEELESKLSEAVSTETERAQTQIAQMKKLNRQKDLQKKRDEAKKKMVNKTKEMDILMKARLTDFKKKATTQTKKLQKNSVEFETNNMIKEMTQTDALEVAVAVATKDVPNFGEHDLAKIKFGDGSVQNLDNFSAKKIAACYGQLGDAHKDQFRFLLNKDAASFQSALDFAIRNV